jgi:hypothetical protein
MSVNASLQFDNPDAACQSLLIYQSWAGNLYCVNAKAGPLPGWGYQGNCSCADPNTRGLYEPGCPSGSIPANDSLGGVACRTVNANLIKKPSDGICNMIAQGNTFIADNGGGFNGGDPDCNSACTVCVTGYHFDAAGTSCVQDEYTLTLSGGSEIEPSQTAQVIATVKDAQGNGKSGVTVSIKVDVEAGSGGHEHDAGRHVSPYTGTLSAASGTTVADGTVSFTFGAPEISGVHTFTAQCDSPICTNNPQTSRINVMVPGLLPIPPSGLYALYEADGSVIGAVKGRHPSNHYLTPAAANQLLVIAINYHHLNPQAPVLHINDASLMWGGMFDIDAEADWNTPHKEHRRGMSSIFEPHVLVQFPVSFDSCQAWKR